jgi:hypothetical protein
MIWFSSSQWFKSEPLTSTAIEIWSVYILALGKESRARAGYREGRGGEGRRGVILLGHGNNGSTLSSQDQEQHFKFFYNSPCDLPFLQHKKTDIF